MSIYFNCAAHFIWHCHTVFHYSLVASAAAVFFHICFIIYYGSYNTQTNKHFIAWAEKQHALHRYKSHLYTSISSEPTARLKKKTAWKKIPEQKKFIEFEIRETSESKTAAAHFMSMRCNDSVGDWTKKHTIENSLSTYYYETKREYRKIFCM